MLNQVHNEPTMRNPKVFSDALVDQLFSSFPAMMLLTRLIYVVLAIFETTRLKLAETLIRETHTHVRVAVGISITEHPSTLHDA